MVYTFVFCNSNTQIGPLIAFQQIRFRFPECTLNQIHISIDAKMDNISFKLLNQMLIYFPAFFGRLIKIIVTDSQGASFLHKFQQGLEALIVSFSKGKIQATMIVFLHFFFNLRKCLFCFSEFIFFKA